LTQAIEDGASQVNTLLDRSGITPQTVAAGMDEDTHGMCVIAVKAFAQAEALKILGDTGPNYEAAWKQWTAMYATISSNPENLGDEFAAGTTVAVDDITSGTAQTYAADPGEFDFFNTKVF
jgi:predicted metal-dependent phosphotriesterase family hydrolase